MVSGLFVLWTVPRLPISGHSHSRESSNEEIHEGTFWVKEHLSCALLFESTFLGPSLGVRYCSREANSGESQKRRCISIRSKPRCCTWGSTRRILASDWRGLLLKLFLWTLNWLITNELQINLAPPESLDAIVHAISEHVHPNFRLFACMNPATDAGKRRLPPSIRTR